MKHFLVITLTAGILAAPALAGEARVQYRLTGLFQPDRVDDLKHQAGVMQTRENDAPTEVKLVAVDYAAATATFAYDPDARHFKGANALQVRERINNLLRAASRNTFTALPLSSLPAERLREERIRVAGHDCKGCAYGAYRAVAGVDGVERATASFKDGLVIAWIDPSKTNRDALIAALEKAQVSVIKVESQAEK